MTTPSEAPSPPPVDHVIVTRFNLPSSGPESLVRARDGWLTSRVALFEGYTVPSVRAQSEQGFDWIVYLDPQSPAWLLDRLAPLVADRVFHPVYREVATWREVVEDAREVTGGRGSILITSNLDNDDALAVDFVERLQRHAAAKGQAGTGRREALYLATGLILQGGRAYLRRDARNAFCSVAEPWEGAMTAWRDWHIGLSDHMPAVALDGPPAWLQVVHGANVSNRIRGRLVDPSEYRERFAGLIDSVPAPHRGAVLLDAVGRRPLREVKELGRAAGKRVVLGLFGKDGLDRVKERLARARRRRVPHAVGGPADES